MCIRDRIQTVQENLAIFKGAQRLWPRIADAVLNTLQSIRAEPFIRRAPRYSLSTLSSLSFSAALESARDALLTMMQAKTSCARALLQHTAFMSCASCDAMHENFVSASRRTAQSLTITLSEKTCNSIQTACEPYYNSSANANFVRDLALLVRTLRNLSTIVTVRDEPALTNQLRDWTTNQLEVVALELVDSDANLRIWQPRAAANSFFCSYVIKPYGFNEQRFNTLQAPNTSASANLSFTTRLLQTAAPVNDPDGNIFFSSRNDSLDSVSLADSTRLVVSDFKEELTIPASSGASLDANITNTQDPIASPLTNASTSTTPTPPTVAITCANPLTADPLVRSKLFLDIPTNIISSPQSYKGLDLCPQLNDQPVCCSRSYFNNLRTTWVNFSTIMTQRSVASIRSTFTDPLNNLEREVRAHSGTWNSIRDLWPRVSSFVTTAMARIRAGNLDLESRTDAFNKAVTTLNFTAIFETGRDVIRRLTTSKQQCLVALLKHTANMHCAACQANLTSLNLRLVSGETVIQNPETCSEVLAGCQGYYLSLIHI
eukprot:TRINITY_DN8417_c0_g1_i2.p1 TRINITY_DN8417_c0_g1~~TRINITY_DN8417_c0_g1_i2.p1  ORF type:complete len:588 (-),score=185.83 TRINITY_DN8417_c0_g1_i2:61-1698(-)